MIFIILLICVAITLIGCLVSNTDFEEIGIACEFGGFVACAISIVALVVLCIEVSNLSIIDAKIEMYQDENTKIEQQIADTVAKYQQYETDVITSVAPESSITLVALYPELKSDILVQKQIEVYISNNEKIKELKNTQINGNILKWWFYFGGEDNE